MPIRKIFSVVGLVVMASLVGYAIMHRDVQRQVDPAAPVVPEDAASLVVGGGCFWCLEVLFEELKGVYEVENGYAGGNRPNATYQQVLTGMTGHAEVVKIFYDREAISAADLLRLFFVIHDPTTLNRQGPDVGTQYRSVIFYENEEQRQLAERIRNEIQQERIWRNPIVTTIEPLKNYTRAEEYHQDYFAKFERAGPLERMQMNAGYCTAIIEPKVREFRKKFADKLKKK
jgi:peptide-methionine (S)-S-oxide reductase